MACKQRRCRVNASDLIKEFDVGNSAAEFDSDLENYFVETGTFRSVIEDRGDIIAGDKGTGKTAIYRVLKNTTAHMIAFLM